MARKPRNRKAKKRTPRSRAMIPLGIQGIFPPHRMARLRYTTWVKLTSTTGVMSIQKYRANGLVDPDQSFGGSSPFGYDQIAAYYNHYEVQSSTIKVRVVNDPASALEPTVVGLYLADDPTAYTNWTTYVEAARGQHRLVGSANTESHTMRSSFSHNKFYTKKKDNSAPITSDPTEEAFFFLYVQAADQASTTPTIMCEVSIDYIAKFYEPKDIAAS